MQVPFPAAFPLASNPSFTAKPWAGISWQAKRALVQARAGVEPEVTPGVVGVETTDWGLTGAAQGQDRIGLVITDGASVAALPLITNRTRSSTTNAAGETVYTLSNFDIYSPSPTVTNHVNWTYAGGTIFHVVFYNCRFSFGAGYDYFKMDATTGCTVTLDRCSIEGNNQTGDTAFFKAVSGKIIVKNTKVSQLRGYNALLAGATAQIEFVNCRYTNAANDWNDSRPLNYATTAGGTIKWTSCSIDNGNANNAFWLWAVSGGLTPTDFRLELDRVLWNDQNRDTTMQVWGPGTGAPTATQGVAMTNCRFYAGGGGVDLFGNDGTNASSYSNWEIVHCDFLATTMAKVQSKRMMLMGDSNNNSGSTPNKHTNLNFRWCRFSREYTATPYGTAEATQVTNRTTAANETLEMFCTSNCTVEYCWIDKCGEDGFELYTPYANNTVRFCGGSDVNGQMVDCYGGSGWRGDSAGNVLVHDIYGVCKGDGVIIDNIDNVAVRNVYVDNRSGGFLQNMPAARVRVAVGNDDYCRNVVVSGNMGQSSTAFDDNLTMITKAAAVTVLPSDLVVTDGAGGTLVNANARVMAAASSGDSVPATIVGTFTDVTGATQSQVYEAAGEITTSGHADAAIVSITGGEFKLDRGSGYGAWRTNPANIVAGTKIKVRATASANPDTAVNCVLTLAGHLASVHDIVQETFTVDTTAAPSVYDHTITDTANDGYYDQGLTTFDSTLVSAFSGTLNDSYWGCLSFPNVTIPIGATVTAATFYITLGNIQASDSWGLYGEVPQATSNRWSQSKTPVGLTGATGSNSGTTAARNGTATGLKTVDCMTLVANMLGGANWESGDFLNFWILCTTLDAGWLEFNSTTQGTGARLLVSYTV